MIERVLENWLDNASEKSFQLTFCHLLAADGYKIIHLTRHCAMEMGKDIIAISPEGHVCAYQLKSCDGPRITLKQWQENYHQIIELTHQAVVHPSIKKTCQHSSWFVTNKNIDEEVTRAIEDFNSGCEQRGHPEIKINTIVKGQLLDKVKKHSASIWPSELTEIRTFLEIYLMPGNNMFPKDKFSTLLESLLNPNGQELSSQQAKRAISASALVTSLVTEPFVKSNNFFALIEAWALLGSYILLTAERLNLKKNIWGQSFDIVLKTIFNLLGNLQEETIKNPDLIEGDPIFDSHFCKVRLTLIISLLSLYALWRKSEKMELDSVDEQIQDFCLKNKDAICLCGEYAIPQFLAFYWYFRNIIATEEPDILISNLIRTLIACQLTISADIFGDPYNNIEDILLSDEFDIRSFKNSSYMIEGLIQILVRANYKQTLKNFWPDITKLSFECFLPEKEWHFYRWRNETGTNLTRQPKLTKQWEELKGESLEMKGEHLPKLLKEYPVFLLLFIIVCPHRAIPESIRYLDSKLFRHSTL